MHGKTQNVMKKFVGLETEKYNFWNAKKKTHKMHEKTQNVMKKFAGWETEKIQFSETPRCVRKPGKNENLLQI